MAGKKAAVSTTFRAIVLAAEEAGVDPMEARMQGRRGSTSSARTPRAHAAERDNAFIVLSSRCLGAAAVRVLLALNF